ncbi:hypothetical protein [Paludisphaera mucosa]|uniref:Carboxypeptidase regulatory-like domain-containing protein n=1 Tax=Paludisphaera mucosa TaxID=3030827 RepID=A0ABT6FC98_9BACT|nr:hypothetical protein [Paludisphaera mucosa]MDG3005005.1 hypothetical protein [Paludisphaera mucosa]
MSPMIRSIPGRSAALLLVAALAGCEGGPPVPLVPARGRVTFRGEPLAGALVIFKPATPPGVDVPLSSGTTDAEGRYVLHTFAGDDGAPAGSYRVGVRVQPPSTENRTFLQKVERAPKKGASAPAERYGDPDRSGLAVEVESGVESLPDLVVD